MDDNKRDLDSTLPRAKGWMSEHLFQYQGVWLSPKTTGKVMLIQQQFNAVPTDILLVTSPKAGTTWLKAIVFATINRANYTDSANHPLLTNNPHNLVSFIEATIDQNPPMIEPSSSSPRLIASHCPYSLLPESVKASTCRIVYFWRDPKDMLVSQWHYLNKLRPKELPSFSLDEAFELFCNGVSHFGPYWDHLLGYWKKALESPERVLFLAYEDMKEKPLDCVKKIAEFLGVPFSCEEQRQGAVEEIVRLCSFENLSNVEVNKTGIQQIGTQFFVKCRNFFRKGEVGDWKNYLTSKMAEELDQIMMQKLKGSGLEFPRPK